MRGSLIGGSRNATDDVVGLNRRLNRALGQLIGVTGASGRDQHMLLRREGGRGWRLAEARMPAARDADIALGPQPLAANALDQSRKRAHGEIDGAGLEPGVQMLRI